MGILCLLGVFVLLGLFSGQIGSRVWHSFSIDLKPIPAPPYFDEKVVEDDLWRYVIMEHSGEFESRSSYQYQYQLLGNDAVKIQAVCNEFENSKLHTEWLVVDDGGSCFFEMEYNFSTKVFSNLYVSGEA